jgi:hypothetical protein
MPFGGVKSSGYSRFDSKAVIDEFTDLRWITIEDRSTTRSDAAGGGSHERDPPH